LRTLPYNHPSLYQEPQAWDQVLSQPCANLLFVLFRKAGQDWDRLLSASVSFALNGRVRQYKYTYMRPFPCQDLPDWAFQSSSFRLSLPPLSL
jgi:hypothetical protein